MTDFLRPPDNDQEMRRFLQELCRVSNKRIMATQSDSTASDVAGIVADFNTLLAALRTAFE